MTPRERAVAMAADLTRSPESDPVVQRYADRIEPRLDTMPDADLRTALIDEAAARVHAAAAVIRRMAAEQDAAA